MASERFFRKINPYADAATVSINMKIANNNFAGKLRRTDEMGAGAGWDGVFVAGGGGGGVVVKVGVGMGDLNTWGEFCEDGEDGEMSIGDFLNEYITIL